MNDIPKDVDVAAVAVLISDPSWAIMLDALLNKQKLPAGELAYRAGILPQTASAHLAKLAEDDLLILKVQGWHCYSIQKWRTRWKPWQSLLLRREYVLCEP